MLLKKLKENACTGIIGMTCSYSAHNDDRLVIVFIQHHRTGSQQRMIIARSSMFVAIRDWSYKASKHLGTFLLTIQPSWLSQNVSEINEDKINKNQCCWRILSNVFSYVQGKICRTSKKFAGAVEPRCYWSCEVSNILSQH